MSPALEELSKTIERMPDDMEAASAFVERLYSLSVDGWTDEAFQQLEDIITDAIQLLSRSPEQQASQLIEKLKVSLDGIEQGLPPDPARRPSREQLAQDFEDDLRGLGF